MRLMTRRRLASALPFMRVRKLARPVRFAALTAVLCALLGCEQSQTLPTASSAMGGSLPLSSISTQEAATETARPLVPPPHFHIFKEHTSLGVAFVVPVKSTDEELKSLLWLFRDKVHSGKFTDLGLRSGEWSELNGGLFHVYRGPRCANEMYELDAPCGNEAHAAAYFQWGLRQESRRDAGYLQKENGSEELIFGHVD